MVIWKKKLIKCCRCHKDYSFDNNLFFHLKDYILGCPYCNLMHKVDIRLLDDKYKGLKKVDKLILTAITMGSTASDRATADIKGYTYISKNTPATGTGKITNIEIWVATQAMNSLIVATFYAVDATHYTTRDYETISGDITAGSKQTKTVDLDVVAGDLIGYYWNAYTSAALECDNTGGSGILYATGNVIPCTNQAFSVLRAAGIHSLKGIGATAADNTPIMVGVNF